MATEEEAGVRLPARCGEDGKSPTSGLGAASSDKSGKVGSAHAEGLVSVLWARGKAVHQHGHSGIFMQPSRAAAWPATRIPPSMSPTPPFSPWGWPILSECGNRCGSSLGPLCLIAQPVVFSIQHRLRLFPRHL